MQRSKAPHRPSPLWSRWEKTLKTKGRRIVLIDAPSGKKWTAAALTRETEKYTSALASFPLKTKIAFCLPNGAEWLALFLALQKQGLTAVPLDAGLPVDAARDLARQLGCAAIHLTDSFQRLDPTPLTMKDISCVKVTSGTSSGIPKQVDCRAEHLLADGTNIIRTMGVRPQDRNLATIPLGHSYGLGNFVMPLILQGTTVVCAGSYMPQQLVEWIGRYRVTVFPSVPAIFRVLAALPGKSRLTPLRLAISAGAPLTAEVARTFFVRYGTKIHNFYGSSETGGISYDRTGAATLEGRSVGKPLTGVSITASRGEITVRSSAVAMPGGSWRTPDRGEWNKEGELVLLGRSGGEVNLGGKKVHPSEVERALRTVPGVSDAMVWTALSGERAFLQTAVETHLSLSDLQQALATKLPSWKFPKHYFLTPEFPRTARGKADVAALRRKLDKT